MFAVAPVDELSPTRNGELASCNRLGDILHEVNEHWLVKAIASIVTI